MQKDGPELAQPQGLKHPGLTAVASLADRENMFLPSAGSNLRAEKAGKHDISFQFKTERDEHEICLF